jgi:hypothetical protein
METHIWFIGQIPANDLLALKTQYRTIQRINLSAQGAWVGWW